MEREYNHIILEVIMFFLLLLLIVLLLFLRHFFFSLQRRNVKATFLNLFSCLQLRDNHNAVTFPYLAVRVRTET